MAFDLVFFGGTGDLTWRKLMPALFQAFRHGKLPGDGRILAVARDEQSDEKYRAWLKERFQEVEGDKRPSSEQFERFAAQVFYRRMDLSQPEHYAKLKEWLGSREGANGPTPADTVVFYLATSPHLFTQICEQLGAAGLNHGKVRVVLEKPLGHDLASSQHINRVVRSVFEEQQAFRIDDYLGKRTAPAPSSTHGGWRVRATARRNECTGARHGQVQRRRRGGARWTPALGSAYSSALQGAGSGEK